MRDYIRHLKTVETARLADEARLRALKIEAAEHRNAAYRDRLFKEWLADANVWTGKLMARLDSIPVRALRDLPTRHAIQKAVNAVRNEHAADLRQDTAGGDVAMRSGPSGHSDKPLTTLRDSTKQRA